MKYRFIRTPLEGCFCTLFAVNVKQRCSDAINIGICLSGCWIQKIYFKFELISQGIQSSRIKESSKERLEILLKNIAKKQSPGNVRWKSCSVKHFSGVFFSKVGTLLTHFSCIFSEWLFYRYNIHWEHWILIFKY